HILILKNPECRKHSGLTEDDMTTDEYLGELDPEKARKIEEHNGGHAEEKENKEEETPDSEADVPSEEK
ncbi:MAG: hypothetical protein IJY35_04650, partial [Clostridia bacterium]|nr:hypothetical protein [Clostridia bacterium]